MAGVEAAGAPAVNVSVLNQPPGCRKVQSWKWWRNHHRSTILAMHFYFFRVAISIIYIYIYGLIRVYTHTHTHLYIQMILYIHLLIYIAYIERPGDKVQQHDGPAVMDGIS